MPIHNHFVFFGGAASIVFGLLIIGHDLWRMLTRTFRGKYENWRHFANGLWSTAFGIVFCSGAFDLPHHPSHRTTVLENILLPSSFVILVAQLVADKIDRNRKKACKTPPGTPSGHPSPAPQERTP